MTLLSTVFYTVFATPFCTLASLLVDAAHMQRIYVTGGRVSVVLSLTLCLPRTMA